MPLLALLLFLILLGLVVNLIEWLYEHPGTTAAIGIVGIGTALIVSMLSAQRQRRREREAEASREAFRTYIEEQFEPARPFIDQFVRAYVPEQRTWPIAAQVPVSDIDALHAILLSRHIAVDRDQLPEQVQRQLRSRELEHFERTFRVHSPDLPELPSVDEYIFAYARIFGDSMQYVYLLSEIMSRHFDLTTIAPITSSIEHANAILLKHRRVATI